MLHVRTDGIESRLNYFGDRLKSDAFENDLSSEEDEENATDGPKNDKVSGAVSSWQQKNRVAWATPRPPR